MNLRQSLLQDCIYPVLTELRPKFGRGGEIQLAETSPLYDESGPMDSVDLVRFIVVLEERIRAKFGVKVRLTTNSALMENRSPFRNVSALATFVEPLLDGAGADK